MIDNEDEKNATLRMLVSDALKSWKSEAILELLEDQNVTVRTSSARELHARGERETLERAIQLSSRKESTLREIAAFTLGQLGVPKVPFKDQSVPVLLRLCDDRNASVRAAAAAALGHLSFSSMSAEVEKLLLQLMLDKSKDVRSCASYALGNSSGNKIIIKALKTAMKDEYVRPYAELGLDLLKSRSM